MKPQRIIHVFSDYLSENRFKRFFEALLIQVDSFEFGELAETWDVCEVVLCIKASFRKKFFDELMNSGKFVIDELDGRW